MNRRDAIKALMTALPATATLSAAKVEPDDVIVVECDYQVSVASAQGMRDVIQRVWPGRKVLIMNSGQHLKIAKASEAP